jgi:hypothetical protein
MAAVAFYRKISTGHDESRGHAHALETERLLGS